MMMWGNAFRPERKQAWWMTVVAATIVMLAGSFVVIALGSMGTARAASGTMPESQAIALMRGSPAPSATPEATPVRRHEHGSAEAEAGSAAFRVNVNVADADQLALLPGLGKKRAKAVIAWRSLHSFVTAEDLLKVKGIGPAVFEKMSRYVAVEGPPVTGAPPEPTVRAPRPRERRSTRGA